MIDDLRFYDLGTGLDGQDGSPTAGLPKYDDIISLLSFEIGSVKRRCLGVEMFKSYHNFVSSRFVA